MFDVLVIGCGIVGAATAFELSKYALNVCVLEKENDVGDATTKANSAIVHAGYDPEPGTWMARLNVAGAARTELLCKALSVPYKKVGSLVLAFNETDLETIGELYERGCVNGVPGLQILSREETLALEPNLGPSVLGALHAPTGAIVDPWDLCIALSETAVRNGVNINLDQEVVQIRRSEGFYTVTTRTDVYEAKYIVNAAGLYADRIHNMVAEPSFTIRPNKGEYFLLDKNQGELVHSVVFQPPSAVGKGVLVSPTVHGNLIVGPNSESIPDPDDVSTTAAGLKTVREKAVLSVPGIRFGECIRTFAGVRAQTNRSDFILEEAEGAPGFIDLAGIKSPGLTAAPAMALECIALLEKAGLPLPPKETFVQTREKQRFKELSPTEKSACIAENPLYGRVICRCETVTEGEIVRAIHSPIPARTVDAVKKRTNAGMGRCQGGFCGSRVQEILARELGVPIESIEQGKHGTRILYEELGAREEDPHGAI